MKTFTVYKSTTNNWFVEHSLKNTHKRRRICITEHLNETSKVLECIARFENKGYIFIDRYGYNKKSL